MSNLLEREFSLTEILVKTSYQVVISKEASFQSNPIAYGSGFFINYKDNLFFVTADHNIHIEDHNTNERTGKDNYLAVLNNISDKNTISTLLTPIGGFYYMDSFDVSKEDLDHNLIDVTISLVKRDKNWAKFLTDETFLDENKEPLVSPNEQKFEFLDEHIVEPSTHDSYYIYGKIRPHLKGLILHRSFTFKNDLKYNGTYGNFLLLNTKDVINDYEDWSGLSGSPVINQDGKCIGVLCSVIEGTNSVFVKPFSRITPFFDVIILQEELPEKKK